MLPFSLCKMCPYHLTAAALTNLSIKTVTPNICINSFVFFQCTSLTLHLALIITLSVLHNSISLSLDHHVFTFLQFCTSYTNLILSLSSLTKTFFHAKFLHILEIHPSIHRMDHHCHCQFQNHHCHLMQFQDNKNAIKMQL